MRILFLDDDSYRYRQILHARGYNTIIDWVQTASECISALEHPHLYSQIWLDHDLGGEQYVSEANKNTGSEVVRFILEQELPIKCPIYIHSMNECAAKNMTRSLKMAGYDAHYLPFHIAKGRWK